MVRFKVFKGSHLLLAVSILILLAVLCFMLLQGNSQPGNDLSLAQTTTIEAKAQAAFASSSSPALSIRIVPDPIEEETVAENSGKILIYHTHTHEAYQQDHENPYEAIESWRTYDDAHSVVRLGALLAEELRLKGYDVIHDTTDHEQDSLSDSYVRSLHTLESYTEEFDLCIDLHRDAYSKGLKTCVTDAENREYAQLMMLVGRGDNYNGDEKPPYEENLAFAQALTGNINGLFENLCRNVTVKKGRYNQHIGAYNILVEVGHNGNTLQQAIASIPYLARGIHQTMQQFEDNMR